MHRALKNINVVSSKKINDDPSPDCIIPYMLLISNALLLMFNALLLIFNALLLMTCFQYLMPCF